MANQTEDFCKIATDIYEFLNSFRQDLYSLDRQDLYSLETKAAPLETIFEYLLSKLKGIVNKRLASVRRNKEINDRIEESIGLKFETYTNLSDELRKLEFCPFVNQEQLLELISELVTLQEITGAGKGAIEKYKSDKTFRPTGGKSQVEKWLLHAKQDLFLIELERVISCETAAILQLNAEDYTQAIDIFNSGYRDTSNQSLQHYALLTKTLLDIKKKLETIVDRYPMKLGKEDYTIIGKAKSTLRDLEKTPLRKEIKIIIDIESKLELLESDYRLYIVDLIDKELNGPQRINQVIEYCEELQLFEGQEAERQGTYNQLVMCIKAVNEAEAEINALQGKLFPFFWFGSRNHADSLLNKAFQCSLLRRTNYYKETVQKLDSIPLVSVKVIVYARTLFAILLVFSLIGVLVEFLSPNIISAKDTRWLRALPKADANYGLVQDLAIFYEAPAYVVPNRQEGFGVSIRNQSGHTITTTVGFDTGSSVYRDKDQGIDRLVIKNREFGVTEFKFTPIRGESSEQTLDIDIYVEDIEISDNQPDHSTYYFEGPSVPVRSYMRKHVDDLLRVLTGIFSSESALLSLIGLLLTFIFGGNISLKALIRSILDDRQS